MTAALILAAGAATRMQPDASLPGLPKMLLPFRGKALLQYVLEAAAGAADLCMVVTGCFHAEMEPLLQSLNVEALYNPQWQQGMGGSLAFGIRSLQQRYPEVDQAFILVADQPFIDPALLAAMNKAGAENGKGVVACTYAGITGTPVLFNRRYFTQLAALQGQQGARGVVDNHRDDLFCMAFPEGALDIDTPADYARLS